MEVLSIAFLTFQAVLQVVIICVAGFISARTGLLNKNAQKIISQLNVDLFTPCLVFSKLAPSLSLSKMANLAVIPVFFVVSTAISYVCSRVSSAVLGLNHPESDFVTAMAVFGNSNSLPVSLTMSLAYTLPDLLWDDLPNDTADGVASRGILYLLIFQQLGQVLRWSWGYNKLMKKRPLRELYHDTQLDPDSPVLAQMAEEEAALTIARPSPPMGAGERSPLIQYSSDEEVAIERATFDDDDSAKYADATITITPRESRIYRVWKGFVSWMNPPLWAMVVSIVVASVPAFQSAFFTPGTFVNNTVTMAINQLSSVSIPLILIVLGSNLAPSTDVPPATKRYHKIIIGSLMSRMILPSIILLPIIALCVKYINVSILDDPIFLIVAFILTVAPPAIQLSQITQLNNLYQQEMAGILFWGYVVLTLPTTIFIVVTSLEVLKWAL
ncbi:hypothetical protein DIURU_004021 [Diutina rugosa]|uniref:Auxin efflux carrier n=1 Tax=Diutina rugosa TaxID=5481 RepID=A0A642UJA5_DIURU|nr:uncharacterized protein DIURU_004021 [Diutina rugosa]KAA8899980.1 hypothetical protein DIURU_004021 [Diutina rugosa]